MRDWAITWLITTALALAIMTIAGVTLFHPKHGVYDEDHTPNRSFQDRWPAKQ
jgi:hypothetical protein